MDYEKFYEKFLETLTSKYPKRSSTLKHLAAHLRMDQKNLARRMRGETSFTVEDVAKICTYLNISFDSLLVDLDNTVHPMKIYLRDLHGQFMPDSFKSLLLGIAYTAQDKETSRIFICSNLIPNGFLTAYPEITKFMYYAWAYRRYPGEIKAIEDLRIPDEMVEAFSNYGAHARSVKNSKYLFNSEFMENVCKYVLVFHKRGLLSPKFLSVIIDELTRVLDEIEEAAMHGVWPGTDNNIEIYVTDLSLPNSILLTESMYYRSAIIYAFFINPIITVHADTFAEIKTLAYSQLRHSENISVSGENNRAEFIKKQREALAKLSATLHPL